MQEAADQLRMSVRAFYGLIAEHPYYALNGRRKLFSEENITALWNAMREPARKKHRSLDLGSPGSGFYLPGDYSDLLKRKRKKRP